MLNNGVHANLRKMYYDQCTLPLIAVYQDGDLYNLHYSSAGRHVPMLLMTHDLQTQMYGWSLVKRAMKTIRILADAGLWFYDIHILNLYAHYGDASMDDEIFKEHEKHPRFISGQVYDWNRVTAADINHNGFYPPNLLREPARSADKLYHAMLGAFAVSIMQFFV